VAAAPPTIRNSSQRQSGLKAVRENRSFFTTGVAAGALQLFSEFLQLHQSFESLGDSKGKVCPDQATVDVSLISLDYRIKFERRWFHRQSLSYAANSWDHPALAYLENLEPYRRVEAEHVVDKSVGVRDLIREGTVVHRHQPAGVDVLG
jgi:hypothetical protein